MKSSIRCKPFDWTQRGGESVKKKKKRQRILLSYNHLVGRIVSVIKPNFN